MLNPECLNPKDVLAHLNSLGYNRVSPQKLKEFLHDLKKLIKYDQKQALKKCLGSEITNTGPSECTCSCLECDELSKKFSSTESYCESSTCASPCPTSATYSSNTSKRTQFKKTSARNPTESDQTAHTSFIRPWNIQGYKELTNRGKKNLDPVRLYHRYKEFWKNQNIPGESKHSELRWVIRNKMLGQEPHPRVVISNPKYFS